jgi:UDP-N-acetylglucosamine--N-acetylmuramyl-(pentapeptide) pyrophosphoryl-undecaprenol N-acetylglucosamine transferase
MERFFPKDKIVLTGNPVRKSISDMSRTGDEGKAWFGLLNRGTTILVVGGSLGAKSINESVDAFLDEIMKEDVNIIWQTGKLYYEQARRRGADYRNRVKVFDFIREMDYAYAAADIVISRAGALAIAELCIAAKPVIFVPYPHAAEDHQTSNAASLVKHGAAVLVKDRHVQTELLSELKTILNDNDKQKSMSDNLSALAIRDADDRIAKKIIEIAGV